MATVIHQTEDTISGIWFFNHERLAQLDLIFDNAEKPLNEIRKRDLEKAVKREQREAEALGLYELLNDEQRKKMDKDVRKRTEESWDFSQDKREIAIQCRSGKQVLVGRFEEAFTRPELQNEIPTGFTAGLRIGNVKVAVEVQSYAQNRMAIQVSPENEPVSPELFERLRLWARNNRQPEWQWWWKNLIGAQWPLWFIMVFGLLGGVNASVPSSKESQEARHERARLKTEAKQLAEKGVTKENEAEALTLLLKIASDSPQAPPPDVSIRIPIWWVVLTVATLIVAICLSFPPKTTIGIGLGADILRRRQRWMRWIGFMFVTVALLGIGMGLLTNTLYDALKG